MSLTNITQTDENQDSFDDNFDNDPSQSLANGQDTPDSDEADLGSEDMEEETGDLDEETEDLEDTDDLEEEELEEDDIDEETGGTDDLDAPTMGTGKGYDDEETDDETTGTP